MLNMDHRMDMMLVWKMTLNNYLLDRVFDTMEVMKKCNKNWMDRLVEFRRMKVAFEFVEFVVDNDDDEIDLVRIHFLLIHEFANLNNHFEKR